MIRKKKTRPSFNLQIYAAFSFFHKFFFQQNKLRKKIKIISRNLKALNLVLNFRKKRKER